MCSNLNSKFRHKAIQILHIQTKPGNCEKQKAQLLLCAYLCPKASKCTRSFFYLLT